MRKLALVAVATLGCLFGPSTDRAGAQQSPDGDAAWRAVLRQQLSDAHRCTLATILFVNEVQVGADIGLQGRVKCTDEREFDFTRMKQHQRFEIRLCQPVAC